VAILTDQPDHFEPFRPLPASWIEVCVRGNPHAWQQALQSAAANHDLLVVAPLNRENSVAAMEAARGRTVFGALDTVLAGLDTSYVLRDMGVTYSGFADTVQCVWSQFLVNALCVRCAEDASVSAQESEILFSNGRTSRTVRRETGCLECKGQGTNGRVAISDITFISDSVRPVVKGALVRGVNIALSSDSHVSAREQAQELLETGNIGVNTYRDAIQRNPLLRTQIALEHLKAQAARLSGTFDQLDSRRPSRRPKSSNQAFAGSCTGQGRRPQDCRHPSQCAGGK